MTESSLPTGGSFLVGQAAPESVFVPEMLDAEARLMAKTMEEFLRREVLPAADRLEAQEPGRMRALLQQAGALGLLGGSVPERNGGFGLPKTALALLAEKAAPYLSFAIAAGVHSGVATLPLLFFGTPEQKAKYLPKLASGEWIGAFALSEANSGSDALGAQARASLAPDGVSYLLNGEKMWTTNGGFADLFTVFAKVDGEKFTAFLVERDTPGLSFGREERKMGLHGSSTCRLLLQNAAVPAENVLGEVGKGHRPALYALNIGRFHIGVTALGAAKECLRLAAQYAQQRAQFGQPLSSFGLIQHKLAEMAIRILALESMAYRVAGDWDARLEQADANLPEETFRALSEEYAIECAAIKVFGTEVLGFAADEALQIHGGYGFSEEFPIAQMYRDARVFRIFEGTNEINRLFLAEQILRRAPLPEANRNSGNGPTQADAPALQQTGEALELLRQRLLSDLEEGKAILSRPQGERQEVSAMVADRVITLFALESAWLRASRLHTGQGISTAAGREAAELAAIAAQGFTRAACFPPESRPLSPFAPAVQDMLFLYRRIAAAVIERGGYPW